MIDSQPPLSNGSGRNVAQVLLLPGPVVVEAERAEHAIVVATWIGPRAEANVAVWMDT